MSFEPTNRPVPSDDPRDLYANSGILDEYVNSASPTMVDRTGVVRKTLAGVTEDADAELLRSQLAQSDGAELIGAGPRTQAQKNGDVVSLLDFTPVAVGDNGVTNNQAAIAAAVAGANGRTIYVPVDAAGGQYAITSGSVDLAGVNFIYEPGARVFAQGGTITNQPNFYSLFAGGTNGAGRTSRSHGSIHELRDVLSGIAYGAGADTYAIHRKRIYNDRLDAVSDPAAGTKVDGFLLHHSFGGAGTKGGRHGIEAILDQTGITDSDNTDRNYAALVGQARTSTGDGGTLGNEKGGYFGGNFYGMLLNGAMHCYNVTSCEFNVAIATGASAKYRSGIQVVGGGTSRGTETDAAISVSNLGTASAFWKDGLRFGRQNGQPCFNSSSSVITVDQEVVDRVINLETIGAINHILYHPTVKLTTSFQEMTAQSPSLRMGASGVANTPFFRFRSGATAAPAYDSQIIMSGGNGADGNGTISINAATLALAGIFRPTVDNLYSLGTASFRNNVIYAATSTISTSDERSKQQIKPIDEACLQAWAKVEYAQYKFNDAVEAKGDGARWHFGLIAQRVEEVFAAEGLNARDYGLLCHDEWPDQYEDIPAVYEDIPAVLSSLVGPDGKQIVIKPAERVEILPASKKLICAAGDRYGIRYEEALALECAYLRSQLNKA